MSIEAQTATAAGFPFGQQPLDVQGRRSHPHGAGRSAVELGERIVRQRADRRCARGRLAGAVRTAAATPQIARCAAAQASSNTTSRTGVVRLTDQVWFSNGKDEFRGDVVIYNVRDERVQINPGGSLPDRVRGIIRPAPATEREQEPLRRRAEGQRRRSAARTAHESPARRRARQKISFAPGGQVTFRSRSRAAKSSACSARTAPARPLRST